MKVIGIVVEYNPFHNGHLYQIKKVKDLYPDSIIIIVMSSSFTQRGEVSILSKSEKTKIALYYGIDLIIELPYVFSVQSADTFAYGAITLLNEVKIDTLVFGSESEDITKLKKIASFQLNNKNFNKLIKEKMKEGINYPTALSRVLEALLNETVSGSNDILAISYIKEILKIKRNIEIFPIKRDNKYPDLKFNEKIISATNIRKKIQDKRRIKSYVPKYCYKFLKKLNFDCNKYFELLKYKIAVSSELKKYLDVDEGIENKIKSSILVSNNMDELINNIKSKRYTYNKISRMLNHILTEFSKEEAKKFKNVEYIRILGFSKKGQEYLNKIKKEVTLPIISKFNNKYEMLSYEISITILYSIIINNNVLIKEEYTSFPIKN